MKKIILTAIILLSLSINNTFADIKTDIFINKISNNIQKVINNKGIKYKNKIIYSLQKFLNKSKINSSKYNIIDKIIKKTKASSLNIIANKDYKKNKIDINKIKIEWLKLHNSVRKNLKLNIYKYNKKLDSTAYDRSNSMNNKGKMNHKRYSNSSFYDYKTIEKWFKDRGVICKNINGITTTESIGAFSYFCKKSSKNCNNELMKSLKQIFDIYLNEKGLRYPANAHYRAIVHPNLNYIGLGIKITKSISPSKKNREYYKDYDYYKYYVTTHYCSEFLK